MRWIKTPLLIIRDFLLLLADGLFVCLLPKGRASDVPVLVVRFDEIGDFIVWLDAARGLRDLYKNRPLYLAANKVWAELAGPTGLFDKVVACDVRALRVNLVYRYKMLGLFRRMGVGQVVHPTFARWRHWSDAEAVVRTCGAKERIGSVGGRPDNWRNRLGSNFYSQLIPAYPEREMELKQNAEFIRGLGLIGFKAHYPELPSYKAEQGDVNPGKAYYALFPGAGKDYRRWPGQNFSAIAKRIHAKTNWAGVICGSVQEYGLGETVRRGGGETPLQNLCGKTSLPQLASIIQRAALVVCNETSAFHMAVAYCTPVVCILGGGHYGIYAPYDAEEQGEKKPPMGVVYRQMACFNCGWKCIFPFSRNGPVPCIRDVAIDKVWAAVESVLNNRNSSETEYS